MCLAKITYFSLQILFLRKILRKKMSGVDIPHKLNSIKCLQEMLQYFDTHLKDFFQVHFVVGGVLTKISIPIILYKELTIEKP
jgi:hypothetical protein